MAYAKMHPGTKTIIPVLVTTCNRADKLQICLESLNNNNYAKYCDLIVSVDYPPDKSYNEGHEMVCQYLNGFRCCSHFRDTRFYFQEENLGAAKNSFFLLDIAKEQYNSFIFVEDDYEYSRNYLEFCCKGFELFESDECIFALNGYSGSFTKRQKVQNNKSNIFAYRGMVWGGATWFNRFEKCLSYLTVNNVEQFARNPVMMAKWAITNFGAFANFVYGLLYKNFEYYWNDNGIAPIDVTYDLYAQKYNLVSIYPVKNMVHNSGNDGSGVHDTARRKNRMDDVIEDNSLAFDYCDSSSVKIIRRRKDRHFNVAERAIIILYYVFWRVFKGRLIRPTHAMHI